MKRETLIGDLVCLSMELTMLKGILGGRPHWIRSIEPLYCLDEGKELSQAKDELYLRAASRVLL